MGQGPRPPLVSWNIQAAASSFPPALSLPVAQRGPTPHLGPRWGAPRHRPPSPAPRLPPVRVLRSAELGHPRLLGLSRGPGPCAQPSGAGRPWAVTSGGRPRVVQTEFLIYDPPFYSADRKDKDLVDPVGE